MAGIQRLSTNAIAASGPGEKDEIVTSGFNKQHEFNKHNSVVQCVIYNDTNDTYLSLDDRGVRIWDVQGTELKRTMFPKHERGFLSRIIYVPAMRLYFAAALDMTVQVYDNDFNLQQAVPSGQRSVLCLSFDPKSKELISAGIDGVKVWSFSLERLRTFKSFMRPKIMEAADYCLVERLRVDNFKEILVSRSELQNQARKAEIDGLLTAELMSKTSRNFLTASGVPFAELGADEVAQLEEDTDSDEETAVTKDGGVRVEMSDLGTLKINVDDPSVKEAAAAAAKPKGDSAFLGSGEGGTLAWVFEVCRFDQFLFVVTGGAVIALDVQSGQWLDTWKSMHEQAVTSVVFYSPRGYLLTSSNDCTIKVWSINANLKPPSGDAFRQPGDDTITEVKTFTEHRDAVKQIAVHPNVGLELLVSCSHDCSVRVFHLGTLAEVYRLDMDDPVAGIHISNDDGVAIFSGKKVSIWSLTQVWRLFARCMSKPLAIHRVCPIAPRQGVDVDEEANHDDDPWLAEQLQEAAAAKPKPKPKRPKKAAEGGDGDAEPGSGRPLRRSASDWDEWGDALASQKSATVIDPKTVRADDRAEVRRKNRERAKTLATTRSGVDITVPMDILLPTHEPEPELQGSTECIAVLAAHSVRLLSAKGENVCSAIIKEDGDVVGACFDRELSGGNVDGFVMTAFGTVWVYSLPTSGRHEEDIKPRRIWRHTIDRQACCMARLLCNAEIQRDEENSKRGPGGGAPPASPKSTSFGTAPPTSSQTSPRVSVLKKAKSSVARFLLVGTKEGHLLAMDVEGDGEVRRVQKCHRQAIQMVEWLAADHRVVTMSKTSCKVWEDCTLAPLRSIVLNDEQNDLLGRNLISPMGSVVAAHRGQYNVWSGDALGPSKTNEVMEMVGSGHQAPIVAVDFNPDRCLFLTASSDGNLKVMGRDWQVVCDYKLGRPVHTACFLNARGDIALGTDMTLSLVRASAAYGKANTEVLRKSVLGEDHRVQGTPLHDGVNPFTQIDHADRELAPC